MGKYSLAKGGFFSEIAMCFSHCQNKSLSWTWNLNFPLITVKNLFKFQAQGSDLEYLFWKCEKHIALFEKKPSLVTSLIAILQCEFYFETCFPNKNKEMIFLLSLFSAFLWSLDYQFWLGKMEISRRIVKILPCKAYSRGAIFFVYFAVFCYPRPSNGFVLEQKRKIALFYLKPAERENCVIRRWLVKKLLCSTVCYRASGTYGDSRDLYFHV